MLPPPAEYQYLWDISSGKVPSGSTVRTFGRLNCYDFTQSEAVLTAHHSTGQHKLQVNTRFVEPFSPRLGSHYMALGELESGDECNRRTEKILSREIIHLGNIAEQGLM
ncbi:PREDICTED: CST complex subunit TEN1 isoform X2 [Nanorana parkeri]|uniref:CST complex subunit TEN1 isoform X2 n=1 Tax=Nanorana parkeri TaxID=125878 RepID=UPI000854089A|nr:PREDICTED: CST complex subunit TEN1 isoform X2 [Nanorana parkeri]